MVKNFLNDRPTKVFTFMAAFFVANALIAECIGGKIFSLEKLLGIDPVNFSLFGETGLSFSLGSVTAPFSIAGFLFRAMATI
jgi:hypothetical protein